MHEPGVDRRIQRTRQLLQDALIAMILEKGYDDITIQDILDRANLGRSTFYAHYRDKEDLLLSGFERLFALFQKEFLQTAAQTSDLAQAAKNISLFFFRHAGSHLNLYRAMIGERSGKIILEHAQKSLAEMIYDQLLANFGDGRQEFSLEVLAFYIANSYLALLTWWLDHHLPFSAEQMDTMFQQLVFPGIREVLKLES